MYDFDRLVSPTSVLNLSNLSFSFTKMEKTFNFKVKYLKHVAQRYRYVINDVCYVFGKTFTFKETQYIFFVLLISQSTA